MVSSLLTVGSTWDRFSMFGKTTLHLSLSSLVCNSTLHLIFVYMVAFMGIRYYFFVLFVTPKTSFVQLQVCISLTDADNFVLPGDHGCKQLAKPVPHLFSSCACIPLATSYVSASPGLCYYTRLLYFSIQSHYISGKYLVLYRITACYCYLCKTVVVPHTNKKKK